MVRLKHRYLLFEILYPPSSQPNSRDEKVKFHEFNNSPKDALLHLHGASPPAVNSRAITTLIKRVISDHYGEFGSGTVGASVLLKYFSNKTSTGILRCSRTDFHLVVAALGLIDKVESYRVVVRCVHVSGTIRKCEDYSIKRARRLMTDLGRDNEMEKGLDEFIAMFKKEGEEDDEL